MNNQRKRSKRQVLEEQPQHKCHLEICLKINPAFGAAIREMGQALV